MSKVWNFEHDLDDLAPLRVPFPAKGTTIEKDRVPGTLP